MSGSSRFFCSSSPYVASAQHASECTETPDADAHPGAGDLLQRLQVDLVRLLAAAELLGVRQRQQPGLAEQPEDVARERARRLVGGRPRCQPLGGDLAGQREQVAGLLGGQQTFDGHAGQGRWTGRRAGSACSTAYTGAGTRLAVDGDVDVSLKKAIMSLTGTASVSGSR